MKLSPPVRKILLIVAAALVLLALMGYFGFRRLYALMDTETARVTVAAEAAPLPLSTLPPATPEPSPTPDPHDPLEQQEIYSILLLGTDDRDNALTSRTDTMMLVSINKNTREILLTSFLRDTYIWISGWGCQRLNVANEVGGPGTLIDTLSENYGVTVDNYAYVNFYSFMDVVDAMGGIDLELSDDEVYFINCWVMDGELQLDDQRRVLLDLREDHLYHLDGGQTLAYCRTRDLGSDLVRTSQQRRVITAIWEKAQSISLPRLIELLQLVLPQVTTDITEGTCLSLLAALPRFRDYEIVSQQIPADNAMSFAEIDEMSVVLPELTLNRAIFYNALHGIR